MSDAELAEIRRGVTELHTALALHDQRVDSHVARIAESQERLVAAVERIGDATIAIKALTDQMRTNGKSGNGGLPLDKRTLSMGAAILLVAAIAAGGGAELVRELLSVLKH